MTDDINKTLESYHDDEINIGEAQAVMARALPPPGTYESDPEQFGPLTYRDETVVEKQNGVPTGTTRRVFNFFGRGIARNLRHPDTGETGDYTAMLRFRISPDLRKRPVYVDDTPTGEMTELDDPQTKLWAQAVTAFKATFNEWPKGKLAVADFLRDHPARYRLIRVNVASAARPDPTGEPDVRIVAISAKRQARG